MKFKEVKKIIAVAMAISTLTPSAAYADPMVIQEMEESTVETESSSEINTIPEMTPEVVANITNRYIELYEHITGTKFEKADSTNILARIENNVNECLASLK